MSPKTDKSVLQACHLAFDQGDYKSVPELASRFGINANTLQTRIQREKWVEKKERVLTKVNAVVEKQTVNQVQEYLSSLFLRSKKYEKIIDASQENLGAKTSDGTPLIDPDAIDTYTRSEVRIRDLAFSSLRIPMSATLDVTSGGKSLGANLIDAIQTLRDAPGKPLELSPDQVTYINSLDVTP